MVKVRFRLGEIVPLVCFPKVDDIDNDKIHRGRNRLAKAWENPNRRRREKGDHRPEEPLIRNGDSLQTQKPKSKLKGRISLSPSYSKASQSPPSSVSTKSKMSTRIHSPAHFLEENTPEECGAENKGKALESPEYYSFSQTSSKRYSSREFSRLADSFELSSPGMVTPSNQDDGLDDKSLSTKTRAADEKSDHSARRRKDGKKEHSWNVLATVDNEVVRKKVVLRRSKGERKKLLPPPIADAPCMPSFQLLKRAVEIPQKPLHAKVNTRTSEGSPFLEGGECSLWSFSLGTSSADPSIEIEQCSWEKDLASFTSDSGAFPRGFQEQAFPGRGLHVRLNNLFESAVDDGVATTLSRSVGKSTKSTSLVQSHSEQILGFDDQAVASLDKEPVRIRNVKNARRVLVKPRRKMTAVKTKLKLSPRKPRSHEQEERLISSSESLESLSRGWIGSIPNTNQLKSERSQRPPADSTHSKSRRSPKLSSEPSVSSSPKCQGSKPTACAITSYSEREKSPSARDVASKLSRVQESVAVVKRSFDPFQDFRDSMVEMIHKKNLQNAADLEELLKYYLSLNAPVYQDLIVTVFQDICDEFYSNIT